MCVVINPICLPNCLVKIFVFSLSIVHWMVVTVSYIYATIDRISLNRFGYPLTNREETVSEQLVQWIVITGSAYWGHLPRINTPPIHIFYGTVTTNNNNDNRSSKIMIDIYTYGMVGLLMLI